MAKPPAASLFCWQQKTPGNSLGGGGTRLAAGIALSLPGALGDARRLAAAAAQVIELGTAHLAAAHDLDRIDHRRIERKHALHTLAIGNLAHGEVLVETVPGAADTHAFVGLHAGALALDHLDVDHHRVARGKIRNVLAGGQLFDLLLLELLDQIHGNSPSAAPKKAGLAGAGAREMPFLYGSRRIYDMRTRLSWGFHKKNRRFRKG